MPFYPNINKKEEEPKEVKFVDDDGELITPIKMKKRGRKKKTK